MVFEIRNGFSERSLYDIGGQEFYAYTNATLQQSTPFANVSVQLESLNAAASTSDIKYVFLQIFNTTETDPFYSSELYSLNGEFTKSLPLANATGANEQGGIMLSYSGNTTVFSTEQASGQDAVAVRFENQSIYDYEHWANDLPFGHRLVWSRILWSSSNVPEGQLTQPTYAQVYPILDFDYRLANETAKYVASNPTDTALSPPVRFGFDALGLALYAQNNSQYLGEARAFWNYYIGVSGSGTFCRVCKIDQHFRPGRIRAYGCTSTVEDFTRDFITNTSGAWIEEFAWGTAALYQLQKCTGSVEDRSLYDSFANSFTWSNLNFVDLSTTRVPASMIPTLYISVQRSGRGSDARRDTLQFSSGPGLD